MSSKHARARSPNQKIATVHRRGTLRLPRPCNQRFPWSVWSPQKFGACSLIIPGLITFFDTEVNGFCHCKNSVCLMMLVSADELFDDFFFFLQKLWCWHRLWFQHLPLLSKFNDIKQQFNKILQKKTLVYGQRKQTNLFHSGLSLGWWKIATDVNCNLEPDLHASGIFLNNFGLSLVLPVVGHFLLRYLLRQSISLGFLLFYDATFVRVEKSYTIDANVFWAKQARVTVKKLLSSLTYLKDSNFKFKS